MAAEKIKGLLPYYKGLQIMIYLDTEILTILERFFSPNFPPSDR